MVDINKRNVKIDFFGRLYNFLKKAKKLKDNENREYWFMAEDEAPRKNVYKKSYTQIDFSKILAESLLLKANRGYKIYNYDVIRCIDFFHDNYSFDYIKELTGRNNKDFIKKIRNSKTINLPQKENLIFILSSINEIEALNKKLPNKDFLDLRFHDINTLLNLFNNLNEGFDFDFKTTNEIEIAEVTLFDKEESRNREYIKNFTFKKCDFIKNDFQTFRNLITHHCEFKIQKNDINFYLINKFLNFDGFIYIEMYKFDSKNVIIDKIMIRVSIESIEKSISNVLNELYDEIL
jgi:hypothetical protein